MEQIIKLLPEHICNQIAAGEVIQRPASVIKELVENAIDAEASAVEVYIKDAGKTLIQVVDNGKGMSLVDTKMAFERHATSKISTTDDLFALHTKGFRGEALASIASIAHVTMRTKKADDEVGTLVENEGGKIKNQESVVCKDGTSLEIKNLFYNVPARRNFLKSDNVEFGHIEEEFLRVAMVHENVAFSLFHNDKALYQLPATNFKKRIVDIYGKSMNDKLVPIQQNTDIVEIRGFIGKPEFAKKTRGQQYFFVNNRFFKDAYLHNAIVNAFEGLIPNGTYPSYFIHFEIDPAKIDVNVHPTKTEIKFEYHKEIYAILRSATKEALGKFNIFPTLDFEQETAFDIPYDMKFQPAVEPQIKFNSNYNPFKTSSSSSSGAIRTKADSDYANKSLQSFGFGKQDVSPDAWKNFYQIDDEESADQQGELLESEIMDATIDMDALLIFQQLAVLPLNNQLWVIHIDRANERVVFDALFETFLVQNIASQRLLFPIEFNISNQEKMIWKENDKTIARLGFEWDIQNNTLEIIAAPTIVEAAVIPMVIQEVRDALLKEHFEKGDLAHILIATIATATGKNKKWTKETTLPVLESWFSSKDKLLTPNGNRIVKMWNPIDLLK